MNTITISTILVNICIGCFACVGLTTAISMIQSIILLAVDSLPPAHFLTKGDNL